MASPIAVIGLAWSGRSPREATLADYARVAALVNYMTSYVGETLLACAAAKALTEQSRGALHGLPAAQYRAARAGRALERGRRAPSRRAGRERGARSRSDRRRPQRDGRGVGTGAGRNRPAARRAGVLRRAARRHRQRRLRHVEQRRAARIAGEMMRGIVPMQYAFFRADGRLDLEAFRVQVEACLRAGAPGIAVLGLATEVGKLAPEERSALLEAAAAATRGRAPLSVTVFGQTAGGADRLRARSRACRRRERDPATAAHRRNRRARACTLFRPRDRRGAVRRHPGQLPNTSASGSASRRSSRSRATIRISACSRMEGSAMLVRRTIEETGGALAVLNGRAGLELPDNRRAGASGMIPGAEACDALVRVGRPRRRCGGCGPGGSSLPRGAAAPHIHHAVDGPVPLLRQAPHCAAPGLGRSARPRSRAGADAFGLACLERYAAPLIRTSAWHRG